MRLFVVAVVASFACSPNITLTPQLLVYLDTDAPLPSTQATADILHQPLPLFDRARIEIFPPGDAPCERCSGDFALDADRVATLKASFGVRVPPGVSGYTARVRMYVGRFADDQGVPNADSTIDVWARLPASSDNGLVETTIFLPTDSTGVAASPNALVDATHGAPTRSRVGTWPGAERVSCPQGSPPPPGTACVPGGAFWFGSQDGTPIVGRSTQFHRLVVLSPFFMDLTEVTVAQYRKRYQPVQAWNGSTDGKDIHDWCTYTPTAGAFEGLPMDCITWDQARAYCKSAGGDLVTEAQFVYAGSALGQFISPWGVDQPSCTDAIWGRRGYGILFSSASDKCLSLSKAKKPIGGPENVGSGAIDRLRLADGSAIVDLAGSVNEYSRDRYATEADPCWAPPILRDPYCDGATSKGAGALGGSWATSANLLRADARTWNDIGTSNVGLGLRCTYPP